MLGLLANAWQISGVYRWMSGTPYPIAYSIPGIGNANLTGSDLAYDASGSVVRNNGFGNITGVRPPRTLQLVTRLTF